jgi:DNA-binding NarL/FixJ family response regulator
VDAALHPSVVLIDLMLPSVNDGLAAIRLLDTHRRVCIAISWRESLRQAALEAGASAFIEKGASPEVVLNAVRTACRAEGVQSR